MTTQLGVLAEYRCATEAITAEYHPDDHGGMKYVVFIVGGKHHGIEIHCPTHRSAVALFDSILAARKSGTEHPYLQTV